MGSGQHPSEPGRRKWGGSLHTHVRGDITEPQPVPGSIPSIRPGEQD